MPPRQNRITSGGDYRRIVRKGDRVTGATCISYAVFLAADSGTPARFGFIVSKAVGNAVMRNLVRRRLKAISRELLKRGISNVEVVFRALPRAASVPFVQLRQETIGAIFRLVEKH